MSKFRLNGKLEINLLEGGILLETDEVGLVHCAGKRQQAHASASWGAALQTGSP